MFINHNRSMDGYFILDSGQKQKTFVMIWVFVSVKCSIGNFVMFVIFAQHAQYCKC